MSDNSRHVLLFFLDGVGLGDDDPAANPFLHAALPTLDALLGARWYLTRTPIYGARASLVPTDATLGIAGRPQSASGQATIVTGRNIPQRLGEHVGPWPTRAVRDELARGTLFAEVQAAGRRATLLTPYPPRYFDAIASGRRGHSAVPSAAVAAGVALRSVDDLRAGRAVSPDFTAHAWRAQLGMPDIPLLTHREAGAQLARLAAQHAFSFFEHWPTDILGHRGTLQEAARQLTAIDTVLAGVLAAWDDANGLLLLTSDHGNMESLDHGRHTRNPVPTLLLGAGHRHYAQQIGALDDLAAIVRDFLNLPSVAPS